MKRIKLQLILLCLLPIFLLGCSQRILDFTLISSKNVDLSKGATFVKGKDRVKGKDLVHLIIFFPTGQVSIKEALDRAIESTPGCVALMDGVIYTNFWWIPYIYGQSSATVVGTPLIDTSLGYNIDDIPTYGKIELKKDGSVKEIKELTEEEYFGLTEKLIKTSKKAEHINLEETKLNK